MIFFLFPLEEKSQIFYILQILRSAEVSGACSGTKPDLIVETRASQWAVGLVGTEREDAADDFERLARLRRRGKRPISLAFYLFFASYSIKLWGKCLW